MMGIPFQVFDDLIARSATEYQYIEQRIGSKAIGAMHRYTRAFTHSIESLHDFLGSGFVGRYYLTMKIRRNSTHHVMRGGYYRDGLTDRICMSKLYGNFT